MSKQPSPSNLTALAERIRNTLIGTPLSEKRMFGGITFMHHGNMLCCASKKGLMVRVGKDAEAIALIKPSASRCTGAGRPMPGFIMVEFEGILGDEELSTWIEMALAYVSTLPAKKEKTLLESPHPARGKT